MFYICKLDYEKAYGRMSSEFSSEWCMIDALVQVDVFFLSHSRWTKALLVLELMKETRTKNLKLYQNPLK
jgi:hypothetical protein